MTFGLTFEQEKELHHELSMGVLIISVPVFLVLMFGIDSPWGKHLPKKNAWMLGPPVNARMAWILFESPNLLWSVYAYQHATTKVQGPNLLLFALFVVHYINRAIIFPIQLGNKAKPIPLLVVLCAFFFTSVNGFLQAQGLCRFPLQDLHTARLMVGNILFIIGMNINWEADAILMDLRNKPGETGYKIPRGGIFEYVSGGNHFGEMLEWGGFALACNNLAAFSFWVFTCANLIPRAVSHHKWYLDNFKDYPKNRKAVIPFVW